MRNLKSSRKYLRDDFDSVGLYAKSQIMNSPNFTTESTPTGAPLRRYQTINSTNDAARDWAENGAPHGAVVIANQQTAGRGRRGRDWISPPDCGLLFSMIVRDIETVAHATLGAAVAMAHAIEEICQVSAQVKWPNDILLHNQKIGGILCESHIKNARVDFLIIGIGINVLHAREQLPERPIFPASSLRLECDRELDLRTVENACLKHLASTCAQLQSGDWESVRAAWGKRCYGRGEVVQIVQENEKFYGVLRGIDASGALLVMTTNGVRQVLAGDIKFT